MSIDPFAYHAGGSIAVNSRHELAALKILWMAFSDMVNSGPAGIGAMARTDNYATHLATNYERKVRDRFGL
jgi:hypothetical protein